MTPILYIMMRSDIASLNSGNAMAQAAHAATSFEWKIRNMIGDKSLKADQKEAYELWSNSTKQGFGTKIVLDAFDEAGINDILAAGYHSRFNTIGDIILDPTYPIRDGSVTHYIPLNTCGYVFTDADVWKPKDYPLHK